MKKGMSRVNLIDTLHERGFIENTTHDKEIRGLLDTNGITGYIGFDPTASSLHVGSLVPIMALAHMQRHGHRPIALVGGGTGLVGDPSGKTEMRQMLTIDQVNSNAEGIKKQLARFVDFQDGKALLVNNADWLIELDYISFLRDVGRHFSVNRMIKAESCKTRLESEDGLSFIEFNYMVLQAYDFLELFKQHTCKLQMGGSDQWGNIVAGIDLIRRMTGGAAYGITFPLITTSSGAKMGKTAAGAVWLDPERTSAYDYYQFWVNTDDRDVARFMALFTFLPVDEIQTIAKLEGADLNSAKTVLAFETTSLAHGKEEARKAYNAAAEMFGSRMVPNDILPSSGIHREAFEGADTSVPSSSIDIDTLKGLPAFKIFQSTGLAASTGASRRLIEQGGAYINDRRINDIDYRITDEDIKDKEVLLRSGKKRYHRLKIEGV